MTDDDAKAIREAAEKATPGKWERWANHIFVPGPDGANICSASAPRASGEVKYTAPRLGKKGGVADAHANAAYIAAASPAAVLRLLAELDEANETARMYADALAAVKAEREALRAAHDTVLADLCARTEERDALRAACEAAQWHLGTDADRARLFTAGKGWETSVPEAQVLIRAALDTAP